MLDLELGFIAQKACPENFDVRVNEYYRKYVTVYGGILTAILYIVAPDH